MIFNDLLIRVLNGFGTDGNNCGLSMPEEQSREDGNDLRFHRPRDRDSPTTRIRRLENDRFGKVWSADAIQKLVLRNIDNSDSEIERWWDWLLDVNLRDDPRIGTPLRERCKETKSVCISDWPIFCVIVGRHNQAARDNWSKDVWILY